MDSVKSKIATLEMETLQVGTARKEALVEKGNSCYSLLLQSLRLLGSALCATF